jgi:hypothetical protein
MVFPMIGDFESEIQIQRLCYGRFDVQDGACQSANVLFDDSPQLFSNEESPLIG